MTQRTSAPKAALIAVVTIATSPLAACQIATAQETSVPSSSNPSFPTPRMAEPEPGTDVIMPTQPPRDPDIAVREEYDAAVARNTVAAYELFIARHPGSPLVADIRARLAALR